MKYKEEEKVGKENEVVEAAPVQLDETGIDC